MTNLLVLPGVNAAEHLESEAAAFSQMVEKNLALFYSHEPCIIVGRYNKLSDWVNEKAALSDMIPVIRRFSGGGTVYHDLDTLCYSYIVPRSTYENKRCGIQPMDYFRKIVISGLNTIGIRLTQSRLSDLSLNGRKVSGNAARITKSAVLFHGTLLLKVDYAALERYLPIPPDRPKISHRQFVTSLQNEGIEVEVTSVITALAEALERGLQP